VPELPEVETVRRGIESQVSGHRIVAVAIANPRVIKGQSEAEFIDRVVGKRILCAERRGKHLLLPLRAENSPSSPNPRQDALCVHLNMRGAFRLTDATAPPEKHLCVTFDLESDRESNSLRYIDVWGWGEVVVRDEADARESLSTLGPEPDEPDWNGAFLLKRIAGRRSPIKAMLLEQKNVAGVGNIYADESLFAAGIRPTRAAATLSEEDCARLTDAVRRTLETATDAGGSQGEFTDLWGQTGRFVPRIYDRGGQPCPVCLAPLEKIRLGGRGTTYCLHCQK
jgi:formamidopyrimidine-DNA glycosylase